MPYRALFAAWELWAVRNGGPKVILAFLLFEIAFGIAEIIPVEAGQAESRIAGLQRPPIAKRGLTEHLGSRGRNSRAAFHGQVCNAARAIYGVAARAC